MSKHVTVALDARLLGAALTGVGNFIKHLSIGLTSSDVHVVWLLDREPACTLKGVEQLIWSGPSAHDWERQLPEQLANRNIDVYHATNNTGIPKGLRLPSVLTVHDLIPHKLPWRYFFGTRILRMPGYYAAQLTSMNRATWICVDSQATARDVHHLAPWVMGHTSVVHLGLDAMRSTSKTQQLQAQLSYGITMPYWIYIGGIDPRKNIKRLIQAFSLTRASQSNQLVIVGSGTGYLQPFIDACGLKQRVVLTGYVSDEEKHKLLSGATGLCYPSLYEGFGYPPLEAMAAGVPVVTSNNSSLPEMVGQAAVLVPPRHTQAIASAIDQVTTDAELRQRLIHDGLAQVQQFPWQQTVDAYVEVYLRLIHQPKH